ncbi:casein kinase ii subunit alpha [Anaeramoeba ignava]|uniref:non-specific serine/threonine protein kinase n=1 Tax=Anaeramoeba ignava TaxID=1746090 RepID=A0A9Q0LVL0_ANAIG|nr:casein kinase ii subunit alpha [Anaeramoeba ignava]
MIPFIQNLIIKIIFILIIFEFFLQVLDFFIEKEIEKEFEKEIEKEFDSFYFFGNWKIQNPINISNNTFVNIKNYCIRKSSISRVYSQVNNKNNKDVWDLDLFNIKYGNPNNYKKAEKIGSGKYSNVYLCENKKYVIKELKPISLNKIKREIKVLEILEGKNNTIKLLDVFKNEEEEEEGKNQSCLDSRYHNCTSVSLVFEYIENINYKELYPNLTKQEIKYYMKQLLIALDYSHSKGIMHRDVKPSNVLIDHQNHRLELCDWGLGEFYHPGKEYIVRVATRYYKAPELLLQKKDYDYSVDMWAFGCLFAGVVFRSNAIFKGSNNSDQLVKIVEQLGFNDLDQYLIQNHLFLDSEVFEIVKYFEKKDFSPFVNEENQDIANQNAIDLIEKLLVYDSKKRLTAREALEHQYFQEE